MSRVPMALKISHVFIANNSIKYVISLYTTYILFQTYTYTEQSLQKVCND